jgi:hypothetical protein
MLIGWAEADITPTEPILMVGQFHARLSEGIDDPITATVLAVDCKEDHFVFVTCDLVSISENLCTAVRTRVGKPQLDGLDPWKVILNGTHTHTGPETRVPPIELGSFPSDIGVDLPTQPIEEYAEFAADRITTAVLEAWSSRTPGGIAFGQGHAIVGRNRRWVNKEGRSTMYGDTDVPDFDHIEGYEDHSVNVMATYLENGSLSGLVVNVPCPAQVDELGYRVSADYWYETRMELRRRLGEGLPVLAQCSAAGDQSPHLLFDRRSTERMLSLAGRTERQEIAHRISNAIEEVLEWTSKEVDHSPLLHHSFDVIDLPMSGLTEEDAKEAGREVESLRRLYEEEKRKIDDDPTLLDQPHWYKSITFLYRRMRWFEGVIDRYRLKEHSTYPVEFHVIRLGDMAFATNPFEYYLDFGIYIKARSRATQTFLVQLAGSGTYVPSRRSTKGGGYGSIPASNPVGYEGGRQLAEKTVEVIDSLWEET